MELNGNKENTVNTEEAEKTEGPEEPGSSVIDHTPEA
jgi:hypothetical protein